MLATSFGLLLAGLATAAYVCGRAAAEALARGALGCLAVCAAIWYAWPLEEAGYLTALVLGLGLAAAIAIRSPGGNAWIARLVAISALAGFGLVTDDEAAPMLVLLLLVAPAIGVADTIALGSARSRADSAGLDP